MALLKSRTIKDSQESRHRDEEGRSMYNDFQKKRSFPVNVVEH